MQKVKTDHISRGLVSLGIHEEIVNTKKRKKKKRNETLSGRILPQLLDKDAFSERESGIVKPASTVH